jgi:hypothetical protein
MPVALAVLPELVIGLVLILLLWAARALFGGMLSSLSSRIPFLGNVIATAIDGMIADIVSVASSLAQSAISGAYGLILGPVFWVEHILADIWDTFDAVRQVIAYITGTLISMAVNIAVAEARVLIARAVAELESLINSVYNITQIEFRQVYATINAVESALANFIRAEITAVEQQLTAAIDAETAFVVSEAHALENQITASISAETAFVEQEFAASVAYTEAAVIGVEGTITADTSVITAWVLGQLGSLVSSIDLVQAMSVAFTIASVKAVETDLGNLKSDCTDNLCSGLGGAASLINGLLEQGFIAALLGYTAWAMADPLAAGNATAEVLVPIATGAKDAVDAAVAAV